jgi:hypothetical protein
MAFAAASERYHVLSSQGMAVPRIDHGACGSSLF